MWEMFWGAKRPKTPLISASNIKSFNILQIFLCSEIQKFSGNQSFQISKLESPETKVELSGKFSKYNETKIFNEKN